MFTKIGRNLSPVNIHTRTYVRLSSSTTNNWCRNSHFSSFPHNIAVTYAFHKEDAHVKAISYSQNIKKLIRKTIYHQSLGQCTPVFHHTTHCHKSVVYLKYIIRKRACISQFISYFFTRKKVHADWRHINKYLTYVPTRYDKKQQKYSFCILLIVAYSRTHT